MTPTDPTGSAPTETEPVDTSASTPHRVLRAAIWLPGLTVGLGAAVATAHGLFEVARAAGAPPLIAALYPLITDGLALVAYTTTTRLLGPGRRYAWAVVVLAAGLSGLAQASYLAGGVEAAPAALRFGVGAWPAVAAAIVAHLLYLLLTEHASGTTSEAASIAQPVQRSAVNGAVQPPPVQPSQDAPTECSKDRRHRSEGPPVQPAAEQHTPGVASAPARDRARSAARRHASHHGDLPTVTELTALAEVARGTAAAALRELRAHPAPLHAVHPDRD